MGPRPESTNPSAPASSTRRQLLPALFTTAGFAPMSELSLRRCKQLCRRRLNVAETVT